MKKLGGLGAGKEAFDNTNNINIGFHYFQNAPPPADHAPPDLPTGVHQDTVQGLQGKPSVQEKGADRCANQIRC